MGESTAAAAAAVTVAPSAQALACTSSWWCCEHVCTKCEEKCSCQMLLCRRCRGRKSSAIGFNEFHSPVSHIQPSQRLSPPVDGWAHCRRMRRECIACVGQTHRTIFTNTHITYYTTCARRNCWERRSLLNCWNALAYFLSSTAAAGHCVCNSHRPTFARINVWASDRGEKNTTASAASKCHQQTLATISPAASRMAFVASGGIHVTD